MENHRKRVYKGLLIEILEQLLWQQYIRWIESGKNRTGILNLFNYFPLLY